MARGAVAVTPCAHCGAADAPYACSQCRSIRFCTTDCQRAAWPQHKALCRASASGGATSSTSRAPQRASVFTGSEAADMGNTRPAPIQSSSVQRVENGERGWMTLMNVDSLPGQDFGSASVKEDNGKAVRHRCEEQGLGGYVAWRGTAFVRAQSAPELLAAAKPSLGSELWLPIVPLRQSSVSPLPFDLPEVVVKGAKLVDKLENVSLQHMHERFLRSKPVVLTDAQRDWPAQTKWTFEWLAQNYGKEIQICSDLAPFFRHSDRGKIQTIKVPMHEYVRYIRGQPNAVRRLQKSLDGVFYANGWSPFLEHEDLLEDVSDRIYCIEDSIPRGEGVAKQMNLSLSKVFIGPAGTVSRLHHDTYASHVWLSQIRGRKQFIVYPPDDADRLHCQEEDISGGRTSLFDPSAPDFKVFPNAQRASPFSVIVEEGETVVLPSKWWHWAKSLTPSITLMRNFVNSTNIAEYAAIRQKVAERAKTSQ